MTKLPSLRGVSRRDALLVLLGFAFTHLASVVFQHSKQSSPSVFIHTGWGPPEPIDSEPYAPPPEPKWRPPVDFEPGATEDEQKLLETSVVAHAPGWTIFRNAYMSRGTLFLVARDLDRAHFPERRMMISTGEEEWNTPENIAAREPTDGQMQFIDLEEAKRRWGGEDGEENRVWTMEGGTILYNDPPQFLTHFYHFVGELLLGTWAFWSGAFSRTSFDPKSLSTPSSPSLNHAIKPRAPPLFTLHDEVYMHGIPPVHRTIFAHAPANSWRDKPAINAWFLRAAFPSTAIEAQEDWADRVKATSSTPSVGEKAYLFPTLLLADHSAAYRGALCGTKTQRTASEAWTYMRDAGRLGRAWWEPVRHAVVRWAGASAAQDKVVITYMSRQGDKEREGGERRMLIPENHRALMSELETLVERKNGQGGRTWELDIVWAEVMPVEEQLRRAAKSTILLGVHGNGLAHMVLMPQTKRSTVIELFYPGGFMHDFEWTAKALGHSWFGVWNDTLVTGEQAEDMIPAFPEGFHGNEIPVHVPTIIELIEKRVEGRM